MAGHTLLLISHFQILCFFSDDHSRVILEKIDGNELTDFINANHVDVCIFSHYKHSHCELHSK